MCRLNDGGTFSIELPKPFHDFFTLLRVKVPGGFIGQQEFRVGNDCPRHTNKLLLPAGELTGEKIFLACYLKTASVSQTMLLRRALFTFLHNHGASGFS